MVDPYRQITLLHTVLSSRHQIDRDPKLGLWAAVDDQLTREAHTT
jgi:hypothetical protein